MANQKKNNSKNDVNAARKKRKNKKKEKKAKKVFLLILSLIVIAVAVFVATIKFTNPGFDFSSLVPKEIVEFAQGKLNNSAPQQTTQQTTASTTTEPFMDYIEFEDFDFNTSRQGNYLGNILNGGKVGTDLTYIYYIVDGKGIYRFNPNTEDYALYYESGDNLGSINLRGDYIYFVNLSSGQLCKLRKGKKEPDIVAENVRMAYVYDDNIYYVTNTNSLCSMNVKNLQPTTLYNSGDEQLNFVGISLSRVFFTVTESDGTVNYFTIDNYAHKKSSKFRKSTYHGEILSMEMENGFMYYYELKENGTYSLCRQKFGSDKVVTLLDNVTDFQYVIVDANKLYYSELDNKKLKMKELNMNSNAVKTLLKADTSDTATVPIIQHGWEYDFIIGDSIYSASCVYTSSNNVMTLNDDNKWKYQ